MENTYITGTLVWYYHICKREVWLMVRNIVPDKDDQNMALGRFISESTYKRNKKEIRLENITVDLSKLEDNKIIIGEVKKSSKAPEAAEMQLAFYLYKLKEYGIEAEGELLFPKEKKKKKVILDEKLYQRLETTIEEIRMIAIKDVPPSAIKIGYCANCAYREFCWS